MQNGFLVNIGKTKNNLNLQKQLREYNAAD